MMELEILFDDCAKTTISKGFDVSNFPAQVLLMATEVSEALEVVSPDDPQLDNVRTAFIGLMNLVEHLRKYHKWQAGWEWDEIASQTLREDFPEVQDNFLEELADLQIRLASFIGGNQLTAKFVQTLAKKMEINRSRPHMHGKKN